MNAAWTPAIRPSEAGNVPAHTRMTGSGYPPLPPRAEPWREQLAALDDPWPTVVEIPDDPLDLPPPLPPTLVASRLAAPGSRLRPRDDDTVPLSLVPLPRTEEPVVRALETPPRGLRKFDLGTVPASVTPPRSWRKAAWFAVGTSAAVVCGLAVAAVRLVGAPSPGNTIDALPAYPTNALELENLPAQETSRAPASDSRRPSASSTDTPTRSRTTHRADGAPVSAPVPGSAGEQGPSVPGSSGGGDPGSAPTPTTTPTTTTEPAPPTRTTVGQAAVAATDTTVMGDRTEQYFALVIDDPRAASELCAGGMAKEGPEGIEARYEGVARIEVQEITIDGNRAVTTSRLKVIREDGTATTEKRRLTFTWGDNPRISGEETTG